jgi:hypothetical protein
MLRIRSKLAASGTFFTAAAAVMIAVSAQPTRAQEGQGNCVEGGAGPFCAAVETTIWCPDENGNIVVCGHDVAFLYYERQGNS